MNNKNHTTTNLNWPHPADRDTSLVDLTAAKQQPEEVFAATPLPDSYIPHKAPEIKNAYTKLGEMINEYNLLDEAGKTNYLNTITGWLVLEKDTREYNKTKNMV